MKQEHTSAIPDKAGFRYHQVFAKQIKPLPPEPQLLDIYHPSEGQKMFY